MTPLHILPFLVDRTASEGRQRPLNWLRAALVCFSLIAVGTLVSTANATSPEEKSAARAAAEAGIGAFKDKDYDKALSLLSQAEALVHAPPHLLYIGRSHIELGQFVLAKEALKTLVNEKLRDDAPGAFATSQEIALELLEEIEPLIAKINIEVEGAHDEVRVLIDGKEIPSTVVGLPYPVDPGQHVLVAESGNLRSDEVTITLAEGAARDVVLKLKYQAGTAPLEVEDEEDEDEVAPVKEEPPPPRETKSGVSPFVYVGFGTAAAGIILGSVTGAMSLSKTSSAKKEFCSGDVCDPAGEDKLNAALNLATVANIGFGVAILGVGVGIYGLIAGKPKTSAVMEQAGFRPELHLNGTINSGFVDASWRF